MTVWSEIAIHLDNLDISEAFRRAVAETRRSDEAGQCYRVTVTLKSISYDNCADPTRNEYMFAFSCCCS